MIWRTTLLFDGGFTFTNFLVDVFAVFMFFVWLWLLVTVFGDLFRRHDVSGLGKVLWVVLLVALPYIGVFAYIFTQGRGMAERDVAGEADDDVEAQREQGVDQDLGREIDGVAAAGQRQRAERLGEQRIRRDVGDRHALVVVRGLEVVHRLPARRPPATSDRRRHRDAEVPVPARSPVVGALWKE